MARRKSIYVDSFPHRNPIPAACRVGSLVETGLIHGTDPGTGRFGATIDEQCRLMFGHVKTVIEAAGGTTEDIVKVTVWIRDRDMRPALNVPWVEMFPHADSRPTRHTMKGRFDEPEKMVECSFTAVIGE